MSDEPKAPDDDTPDEDAVSVLEKAINSASTNFLKDRFGLKEGDDGKLYFPQADQFADLGTRADEFVRGFFRGFFTDNVDEARAAAERGEPMPPPPTRREALDGLLKKLGSTLSGSFNQYVNEAVVKPESEDKKVTVDGAFVRDHWMPLLSRVVDSLGTAFKDEGRPGAEADVDASAADGADAPRAEVDVDLDFKSIFWAMFGRRSERDGGES